ncbi:MAG: L-threonylcarbamoyladenylate synthase [Pseudomonadota bacterium]|nr:L-threonylcarbamoyladenylate synthase [Pseudomonadota bacterium]
MSAVVSEEIERAAQLLRTGALIGFPTETVYGLGADARNGDAVRRIFEVKGRPAEHPVIVHLADAQLLPRWAREVSARAEALAEAFWPGPLTLILPRAPSVLDVITGGQDSVGLRVPAHPIAHALLTRLLELGSDGIAAPSANRFGRISATNARHVGDEFGDEIALVLDGGASRHGIESTIVDLSIGDPVLLRPGAITIDALRRVLGVAPQLGSAGSPRASGTLAAHYAPSTPARLVAPEALSDTISSLTRQSYRKAIAVLARSIAKPAQFTGFWIAAPEQSKPYAQGLYANLRALDARGADEIWIETPPDEPDWVAVNDRLRKATHRP